MKYRLLDLPSELLPRERLYQYGADSLSDQELLAIVLRTGSQYENVLDLAERVLVEAGGLTYLARQSLYDLKAQRGIGPVKAAQIMASLELGKRCRARNSAKRTPITCPADAARMVADEMRHLDREHFWVLLLNTKNVCLGIDKVSIGTLNSSVVHPRECFKEAIRRSAHAIILVHNHPSGDTTPSSEDHRVTGRLAESGKLLGIEVLDHLVIGDGDFFSCKEKGIL